MEPDFDKLASNKIRQAELKVSSWNKESVWQNVIYQAKERECKHSLCYSAAAAVLLLLLFGIHQIPGDNKIRYAEANKNAGQQITESQKKIQSDTSGNNRINIGQPAKKNNVVSLPEITQHNSNEILSVNHKEEEVKLTIEPIVANLEFKEDDFLLPEVQTVREQKIRPIVGVIIEPYPEAVAKVKRKKSLHKLESLEPVPWENVPNALVFARKK